MSELFKNLAGKETPEDPKSDEDAAGSSNIPADSPEGGEEVKVPEAHLTSTPESGEDAKAPDAHPTSTREGAEENAKAPQTRSAPIYTSVVVFLSKEGHILTARKKGTQRFMLVGGKPEPGEEPRDAAVREVAEEIGLEIGRGDLDLVGMWRTKAANEAGRDVLGTAYLAKFRLEEMPKPSHEIEELRWLDPAAELPDNLAFLLQTRVMPALAERGDIDYPDAPPALPWDTDHLTDYMKAKLPEDRR